MLRKSLTRGQVEGEAADEAEVIHHALKYYLEPLILGTLIPKVHVNSTDTASAHRKDRTTPWIIVLHTSVTIFYKILITIFTGGLAAEQLVLQILDQHL